MVKLALYGEHTLLGKKLISLFEKEEYELSILTDEFDAKAIEESKLVLFLLPRKLDEEYEDKKIHEEVLNFVLKTISGLRKRIPVIYVSFEGKLYESLNKMIEAYEKPCLIHYLHTLIEDRTLLLNYSYYEDLIMSFINGYENEKEDTHAFEFSNDISERILKEVVSYLEYPRLPKKAQVVDLGGTVTFSEKEIFDKLSSFKSIIEDKEKRIPPLNNYFDSVLFSSYLLLASDIEEPVYDYQYKGFYVRELFKDQNIGSYLLLAGDAYATYSTANGKDVSAKYITLFGNVSYSKRKKNKKDFKVEVLSSDNPQFYEVPPSYSVSITPMRKSAIILCYYDKVLSPSSDEFISAGIGEDRDTFYSELYSPKQQNPYQAINNMVKLQKETYGDESGRKDGKPK